MEKFIVCAAIKDSKGTIVCSARHYDMTMCDILDKIKGFDNISVEQGFIDQFGMFYDRKSALKIATKAGQINIKRIKTNPQDELFSEDLY